MREPTVSKSTSGEMRVVVPIAKEGTDIMVTPGTSEHEILTDTHQEPIRNRQTPVSVQVGTPGLPGWNGIIAQWGAFGVILVLSIAMYSFITGMAKDDRLYIQTRDKDNRDDMKQIFDRMDRRDDRSDRREELLAVTLSAMSTKFEAQTTANNEMLKEVKEGRITAELTLKQILAELKKQDPQRVPPPY